MEGHHVGLDCYDLLPEPLIDLGRGAPADSGILPEIFVSARRFRSQENLGNHQSTYLVAPALTLMFACTRQRIAIPSASLVRGPSSSRLARFANALASARLLPRTAASISVAAVRPSPSNASSVRINWLS